VQICKCFRDEDLRADRQPEFTQVDLEMSFVTEEDVFRVCEGMIYDIWKDAAGIELKTPFKVMSYDKTIETYGIDKPDLRINGGLEIVNVTESVKGSEFKVFSEAISSGGIAAGIKLGSRDVTRKIIDGLTDYVKTLGFGGLGYVKYNSDGTAQSPMLKFLPEEIQFKIKNDFGAKGGDAVFILSGEKKKVLPALGQLRLKLAEMFKLIDESKHEFIWINDFPLFRYNDEEGRYEGEHHVFTMPKEEFIKNLDSNKKEDLLAIRANCYDLVCNGNEFGSGSLRIHRTDLQKKVFNIIGLTEDEAKQKFGFLLEAFTYGAPPHGGFAFGFDRIIAILCGTKDIRETIAFPKTTSALSLMDGCPSPVDDKQLKELGISLIK
jgi:aspartyl-tRNA synthetase